MPIGTCRECQHKYYYSDKYVAMSGRTQAHDHCTRCELKVGRVSDGPVNLDPCPYRMGDWVAILWANPLHYRIVRVEGVTPQNRVMAGDQCFGSGYRCYGPGGGELTPVTPQIEEWCLRDELEKRFHESIKIHDYKSKLTSDHYARMLDILLEVNDG